jgi:hypothetical protein
MSRRSHALQIPGSRFAACLALMGLAFLALAPRDAEATVNPWYVCTSPNVTPGSECTGFTPTPWVYTAPVS